MEEQIEELKKENEELRRIIEALRETIIRRDMMEVGVVGKK